MTALEAIAAGGAVAAAIVAAVAAWWSRSSAHEANAAATTLATIESDRRHSELCPRFRVTCEPWGPGQPMRRLRVMLLGPPSLGRLDGLTVSIRDDHFLRADGSLSAGGPTRDEIRRQIWGPWRFTPGTGPGQVARADQTGRETPYDAVLPVGEELVFQLERTMPPPWVTGTTPDQWQRERGTMIRLGFDARHTEFGSWTLPCEIDLGSGEADISAVVIVGSAGPR